MATATAPLPAARRTQVLADMLGRVFGEEVLVALRDGFAQGDLGGVVPSLFRETASAQVRGAASAAFVAVCETGELSMALLLELADGAVAGDMAVKPECARHKPRLRLRREQRGGRQHLDPRGTAWPRGRRACARAGRRRRR